MLVGGLYGVGRLYYAFTAGFTVSNITSDLAYNAKWDTHPLAVDEREKIDQALNQEYLYLGKGCQSYVFGSLDGKYVLKFFKYQRFRPQSWLNLFTFIPAVEHYQHDKAFQKQDKLNNVFQSWKIAYENLQPETGVIYVHLNKTNAEKNALVIRDKLGLKHELNLEGMEFLLQHRAEMFCPTIDKMMAQAQEKQAEQLIDRLLVMLLSEYERGFADNDHALMQNTGVLDGFPIHIDVGQFIYNDLVKDPVMYKGQIYDKTYRLRAWLEKHHPGLADHLKGRLVAIIDLDYFYMPPYVYKSDMGKIPHVSQSHEYGGSM